MYLFIENRLRGGISYIAKRYSKANNKYLRRYDPAKTEGTRKIFPDEFPCHISLVNPPQFFSNCKYNKAGA